jgi:hypothetical protein
VENDPTVLALLDQIGQVLRPEGRVTAQQCVGNDTHGPHVYGLPVSLFEHDLRGGVAKRACHGGEDFVFRIKHFGDAKVGEHEGRVRVFGEVEEVLGFQVWRTSAGVLTRFRQLSPLWTTLLWWR